MSTVTMIYPPKEVDGKTYMVLQSATVGSLYYRWAQELQRRGLPVDIEEINAMHVVVRCAQDQHEEVQEAMREFYEARQAF